MIAQQRKSLGQLIWKRKRGFNKHLRSYGYLGHKIGHRLSNFLYSILFSAGLLTLDPRKKERSKVNQPGARAKWIWYVIFLNFFVRLPGRFSMNDIEMIGQVQKKPNILFLNRIFSWKQTSLLAIRSNSCPHFPSMNSFKKVPRDP